MSDPSGQEGAVPENLAPLQDRYRIVRLLGRGGMGAVYLAREIELDRLVAIKILKKASPGGEASARERFRREARTAARLTHPGIVPLHAFGEVAEMPYFVMGYVPGESLSARLSREGRISSDEAREVLAGLADALDYAHRQGVIHRDVKPDNVLLDDETGRALLADFGVARLIGATTLTEDGAIVGTPHYMSPEQLGSGGPVDGRSDIYALGLVGFRMLAGRLPFGGEALAECLAKRLTEDAPTLRSVASNVSPDIAAVIDRCLARDPAVRWPDGRAMRDALGVGTRPAVPPALSSVESLAVWYVPAAASALAATVIAPAYGAWRRPELGDFTWAAVLAILLLVPPALRLRGARTQGPSWREVLGAAFWPPRGWMLWYPAFLRRPDDVWARLPRRVRHYRMFATVALLFAVGPAIGLPLIAFLFSSADFSASTLNTILSICFAPLLAFPAYGVAVAAASWSMRRWALRSGLAGEDVVRFLLHEATVSGAFWSKPGVKRLLLPRGDSGGPRTHLEAILAAGGRAADKREPLEQAADVGRRLVSALESASAQVTALGEPRRDQLLGIEGDIAALEARADLPPDQKRMLVLLQEQASLLRGARLHYEAVSRFRAAALEALVGLRRAVEQGDPPSPASAAAIREACRRGNELLDAGIPRRLDDLPTGSMGLAELSTRDDAERK